MIIVKTALAVIIGGLRCAFFGDVKLAGEGIYEARIDYGRSYRLYYADLTKQLLSCFAAAIKICKSVIWPKQKR